MRTCAFGMILFAHSTGLLLTFLLASGVLVIERRNFRLIGVTIISLTFSIILDGTQYLKNLLFRHQLVLDNFPVGNLPFLHYEMGIDLERNMNTFPKKILVGFFSPVFNLRLFGIVFIFLLFLYINLLRNNWSSNPHRRFRSAKPEIFIAQFIVAGFFFVEAISIVVGSNLIVKNPRYVLTVLPSAIYLFSSRIERL
jgi:hypothetical protein